MFYNIYSAPNEKTSPLVAKALLKGVPDSVIYEDGVPRDGNWLGFASPDTLKALDYAYKCGYDWYYFDHGYFGRNTFYRGTKNAKWWIGDFNGADKTRVQLFYKTERPWRNGKYIILCPQSDGYHDRMGESRINWISRVTKILKQYTDRPIIIHGKTDKKPLSAFLPDAHAVVVHSSNSAVEAVLDGVPAFNTYAFHGSPMCCDDLSKIETPFLPENRMDYAAALANNQWTLEEIASGDVWRILNAKI